MKSIARAILCAMVVVVSVDGLTHAATLTFKDEADVIGEVVCLGDISDITGIEDDREVEKLNAIPLCSAPPPAETYVLGLRTIVASLQAHNIDLSQLKVAGSTQILVRRQHDLVSVSELERAVSQYIARQTGWTADSFVASPPKNLRATPVPIGEKVITVETAPNEDFCGSVLAYFRIGINEKLYDTFVHRFNVDHYVEAPIAVRKIPRGHSLNASDMKMKKVEQSHIAGDSFDAIEQATGLIANRTIAPGTVLGEHMLSAPPTVRKGDIAPVVYCGKGFRILTRGHVLEDGATDEIVRVRLSTRKIVRAVVLNSETLELIR